MALEWLEVSLVASHPDGAPVTSAQFVTPLGPIEEGPFHVIADRGRWASARVTLVHARIEDHASAPEPRESFVHAVAAQLELAARWIAARVVTLRALAGAGLRLGVVVTGWISQDQLDLDLPPSFLAACGEAKLPVQILTNE